MTLKQTVESTDTRTAIISSVDEEKGGYVDIGLFKDYVHMGKVDSTILFWLWWGPSIYSPKIADRNHPIATVDGIQVNVKRAQKNEVVVQRLAYMAGPNESEQVILSRRDKAAYSAIIPNLPEIKELSTGSKDYSPQKFYRFSPQMLKILPPVEEEKLRGFSSEFEDHILRTYYLGPLRQNPQRYYLATGETPNDLGLKGQKIGSVLYAKSDDGLIKLTFGCAS